MNFNLSPRTIRTAAGISVVALALIAMSLPVRAQSGAGAPPPPVDNIFYQRIGPGPVTAEVGIGFVGFEAGIGGKTVTGAPFSANVTTQSTQTLADGNTIQHSTTGTFARDSQGRTRRDMTLPAIGPFAASGETPPHMVEINDAVAGVHYILDPSRKIAHKMERRGHGKHANITTSGPGADDQNPGVAIAVQPGPNNPKEVTTTSLGTQTVNGVEAQGTRYTRIIPAGQIGNSKPITIVTERWYSPDLQMVVMNKRTDPMNGDSVTQFADIQRGEPDPALFQVPSDYTVKEGGPAIRIRRFKGRGQAPLPPPPPDAGPNTAPAPPQN
jgi:hypothetical protein